MYGLQQRINTETWNRSSLLHREYYNLCYVYDATLIIAGFAEICKH